MKRSGTDVRKRQFQVGVRLLPEEFGTLRGLAVRAGVSDAEALRMGLRLMSGQAPLHRWKPHAATLATWYCTRCRAVGFDPHPLPVGPCVRTDTRATDSGDLPQQQQGG